MAVAGGDGDWWPCEEREEIKERGAFETIFFKKELTDF